MKTPGIYYGVIAAFCVLTLCIGMVNAMDLTQSATNCTGRPGFGHGHPPSPNEMITHLEQQGVDVTQVRTALQNGDTATVKTWFENYFQAHKPQMMNRPEYPRFDLTNVTRQQQVITKLEQQGVDVTEAKTALQNGDTAAVKAWLDTYRETHKDQMPNSTSRPGPEKIIERLEQQGVDVTQVKTALQNGDTATVKTWFEAYREAHKGQMKDFRMKGNRHAQATP